MRTSGTDAATPTVGCLDCAHSLRSFVSAKIRILRYIPQLAVVHSFLVLLSSAVLLLLSATVVALPWDVHLLFFSFCFFRVCVTSVRYDMFV